MRSIAQDLEEGQMDRGGRNLHHEADRGLHRRCPADPSGHNTEELSVGEAEMVPFKHAHIRFSSSHVLQLATL